MLVARRRRRTGFFCVNCNLCTVFLRSREIGVGCSYAPHDIVTHLREVAPTLRPGRQEDAHEFLIALLDALHEASIAGMQPKPPPELAQTSFIYRIFGGRMRSQVGVGMCMCVCRR